MAAFFDPPRLAIVAALVPAAFLLLFAVPAAAAEWESPEHNVILRTPGEPAPWRWLTVDPAWTAQGVIRMAERRLEKRADGTPAAGEGGILYLFRRKAPKGQTLAQTAESKSVRALFLGRFRGTAKDVQVESTKVASGSNKEGHPALLLRAKGTAANLRDKQGACTGVMVVALAKGYVFLLRMYAFPTEHDRESLEGDLAFMEADQDGLELIDTTEPKPPPRPDVGGGDPGPAPDTGRAIEIENPAQGWRLARHAQLKALALTDEDRKQDVAWRFAESRPSGSYSMWLQAVPDNKRVDGQRVANPDLLAWLTTEWWRKFVEVHTQGDIHTCKWPRKTARRTFVTLPLLEDPKVKVRVVTGKQERPAEVSATDMRRKLKCVEKPGTATIGRRAKVSEPLRGILQGNRERTGVSTEARFAWRHKGHSYRLAVVLTGDAYARWGAAIRATLESLEFGVVKPK